MEQLQKATFYLVGNIPDSFRSATLRSYFSHFVEKKEFICFHYRHRPEQERPKEEAVTAESGPSASANSSKGSEKNPGSAKTPKCCVVALKKESGDGFVKMYRNRNWSLADGSLLPGKVRISRLDVLFESEDDLTPGASNPSSIPFSDLASLPELNPPSVMPQGNVGTPLSTFMTLIRTCKLPAHVIRKLKLEFPGSRSKKRYGAVEFKYREGKGVASLGETSGRLEESGGKGVIRGETSAESGKSDDKGTFSTRCHQGTGDSGTWKREMQQSDEEAEEEDDEIPPDDDHDAEEWERYEALHDDVDKQERTKERLFEEDLEVVWEKGGSGLVFYTDASYWDEQDGDFDEKCSQEDDWDVDMSVYYQPGGGSKDANDMRDMEMERRLRAGEVGCESWKELGGFEKYTKGIGSKVLKKSGWKSGSGVGAKNQGITEPVESDGQHPSVKRGLGYRGEKLNRDVSSAKRQRSMKNTLISTVYDKPEEEESTLLRTAPPTVLKHSQPRHLASHTDVEFLEGGFLNQTDSS